MNQRQTGTDGIAFRPAAWSDLATLQILPFTVGLPAKHEERLGRQDRGEVVYVLAIDNNAIIGHLLLKWDCPEHQVVRALIPGCAEIEDFVVETDYRGRGIGGAMLDHAADLCRAQQILRLGLAVGEENPSARAIYQNRGFVLVPNSEHRVFWRAIDDTGREFDDHEDCVYLVKEVG